LRDIIIGNSAASVFFLIQNTIFKFSILVRTSISDIFSVRNQFFFRVNHLLVWTTGPVDFFYFQLGIFPDQKVLTFIF